MKVWRSQQGILVDCEDCGSKGIVHGAAPTVIVDPVAESKIARAKIALSVLRAGAKIEFENIVKQHAQKKIDAKEAQSQAKALVARHADEVAAANDALPKTAPTEVLEKCPWCGKGSPTTVKILPEGVTEPPEWLAKKAG
jgi:hypothetical protein